jgi:SAM-dependent methyltransferase
MGELRNFVTPLHRSTKRDYLARMNDDKVACMAMAKKYGFDYWDGNRRFGYGGYSFLPGRWKPVAEMLISTYGLVPGSRVLDVGCGKGYLLYELKQLIPDLQVVGFDISEYAIANAKEEIRSSISVRRAQDPFPFADNEFELVISLTCCHNLRLPDLKTALSEMERVGQNKYFLVESYRNELELFNLQCWALTCESFFDAAEWEWLFGEFGYTGDFEFIYFE